MRITVEVSICRGIGIHLVGLPDTAVKESLLRISTALTALDYKIPGKKIVINLAPADVHKSGAGYDLPIAIGILSAAGLETFNNLERYVIMGELGLDGSVRPIPGALPYVDSAAKDGYEGVILPRDSAMEAMQMEGIKVYGVDTLRDVVRILSGEPSGDMLIIKQTGEVRETEPPDAMDMSDIIGQDAAKRALEIAASGSHNLIMVGSPGSGKSSLAKAMTGILPPLTMEESIITSKIYSVAGKGNRAGGLMRRRPFRAPHYSSSMAAIIGGGGGDNLLPGEVSLSHNGVLFLDELALMPRSVLESLRTPLEDRKVCISRLRAKIEYPASFMLVAASNPCPCGYYGDSDKCICTPYQRLNYLSKLSGPLMDRIDLQVYVRAVAPDSLTVARKGETSAEIAVRVAATREIQKRRFAKEGILTNSQMNNRMIEKYCPLSKECTAALSRIMDSTGLSMRAYFRIIRVARTIADMEKAEDISPAHIIEASGFRFLDRNQF